MKPFHALYYCKKNLKKILTVILMICLSGLLYVGGSYLTNIEEVALDVVSRYQDFSFVFQSVNDTDDSAMQTFLNETNQDQRLSVIRMGSGHFDYPTTLGFKNGSDVWCFTPEDFSLINERLSLSVPDTLIKENSLILSEKEARYLGVKDGEEYKNSSEKLYFYYGTGTFTIHTVKNKTFFGALITPEAEDSNMFMVTYHEKADQEYFKEWNEHFKEKYPAMNINPFENRFENVKKNFEVNKLIFLSIIIVVTCVFFITINAVLVGIYEARKNEFLLYHKIGISMKRIYGKIIAELTTIAIIGLISGFLLSSLCITILNRFVYYDNGLELSYFHPWSVVSFLSCNMLILIPSILFRIRAVKRADREE